MKVFRVTIGLCAILWCIVTISKQVAGRSPIECEPQYHGQLEQTFWGPRPENVPPELIDKYYQNKCVVDQVAKKAADGKASLNQLMVAQASLSRTAQQIDAYIPNNSASPTTRREDVEAWLSIANSDLHKVEVINSCVLTEHDFSIASNCNRAPWPQCPVVEVVRFRSDRVGNYERCRVFDDTGILLSEWEYKP